MEYHLEVLFYPALSDRLNAPTSKFSAVDVRKHACLKRLDYSQLANFSAFYGRYAHFIRCTVGNVALFALKMKY
jgi:hypothetical protein